MPKFIMNLADKQLMCLQSLLNQIHCSSYNPSQRDWVRSIIFEAAGVGKYSRSEKGFVGPCGEGLDD